MHKYIMFGKIDVVMKASPGSGIVSSFVLESGDLDEIDWEWVGGDRANVQTNFFGKGNTTTYDRGGFSPVADPMAEFHKYTIDWTAESLKWLIDDVLVRTVSYGDALALGGKNYPQTPMQVKMGSWIGCPSQAAADDPKTKWTCQWAGGPVDLSSPRIMYVKSVTVEDYGCAEEYSYGDMSGSFESIVSTGGCSGGGKKSTSPSSSSATKSTTAESSSSSYASAPGGILIETSPEASVTDSSSLTKPTNTLTTATKSSTALGASISSTATAQNNTVANSAGEALAPKKKYGVMDAAVIALGLGVGYFVM